MEVLAGRAALAIDPRNPISYRAGQFKHEKMNAALLDQIANGRTDLVFDYLAAGNPATAVNEGGTSLIRWCWYYGDVSAINKPRMKCLVCSPAKTSFANLWMVLSRVSRSRKSP